MECRRVLFRSVTDVISQIERRRDRVLFERREVRVRFRRAEACVEFSDRARGIEIPDETADVVRPERREVARAITQIRANLRLVTQRGNLERAAEAATESNLCSRAQAIAVRILSEQRCDRAALSVLL